MAARPRTAGSRSPARLGNTRRPSPHRAPGSTGRCRGAVLRWRGRWAWWRPPKCTTTRNGTGSTPHRHTSGRGDDRQLDEAGLPRCMVEALRGFAIVAGLGPENIGDKSLRIAVVEREPARLNLHHDAVAGQEHVIRRGKREAIEQRLVRRESPGRLKALPVAAAENVGGDHA